MECEKLAQEKTEMQRHYVMYYEMSYGLNVEMHKQVSYVPMRRPQWDRDINIYQLTTYGTVLANNNDYGTESVGKVITRVGGTLVA